MKKILIGLTALSTISFTAQPNISGDAAPNTNVFAPTIGQMGQITVSATIKSISEPPKYVVYASVDGDWNNAEDRVTLPPFVVSQDKITCNFDTTTVPMQSVYVKKITGAANVTDLVSENVFFKITLDPAYSGLVQTQKEVALNSNNFNVPLTSVIKKEKLDTLLASLGAVTTIYGEPEISGKIYRTPNAIGFYQTTLGVLTFSSDDNPPFANSDTMSREMAEKIEQAIGTTGQTGEFIISVRMD